jgi:tetratricopeptide (TPR) repeat protein
MKRLILAAATFLLSTSAIFAQDQPIPAHPKVLPMFGKEAKTEAQQKADEKFLSSCDKSFNSRTEASNFFMDRGWEYLNEGQVDTAVYRFNLAWLLNPDNHNTYWAFGLVEYSKGNTKEAIGMYERALKYQPNNSLLLSDAGAAFITLFNEKKKKKTLKQAITYLDRSLALDPANAFALSSLSQVRFHQKKYAEAWDYLHKGRDINMMSLDYDFLAELMARMPDPKGMFRSETEAAEQAQ